ncbi:MULTISPECIES: hypothetical protein [Burkholderia]|uniref:hypothetical protein n=1 Tax=Burkholderia TaxID=32008 RepID=UPI000A87320C|nr:MULTISPECIES: hypothetical protein [Burkholderia]HDR9083582.1 hypothetical protein [Burkholderia vietnamiensis]
MKPAPSQGAYVTLFTTVPQNLVDWAQSAEGRRAIGVAADAAERAIADLNKEREVTREELHQPVTL